MGEEGEGGETLANVRVKHPPCSRCGCINHTFGKCVVKTHANGTMLHTLGEIVEVEYDINNDVSK